MRLLFVSRSHGRQNDRRARDPDVCAGRTSIGLMNAMSRRSVSDQLSVYSTKAIKYTPHLTEGALNLYEPQRIIALIPYCAPARA